MAEIVVSVVWLVLCLWATSFVFREAPDVVGRRLIYYALIWLVPFFGAVAVIVVVSLGISRSRADSTEAMFGAIVEKHRSINRE